MNADISCVNCGNPIPADAPGGACPRCLIGMGIQRPPVQNETTPYEGQFYAPRPDELTEYFPNLEIVELLGHGGMGAVYRARQVNLDRWVALKVLSPHLSTDPSFAERFTREARTMAKLSHPNIVIVYDFGQAGPYYFLVMELIDGVNLREAIAASSVTPEHALLIVPQICEALQYAHDQGIIHRDIKPENILIGKNRQIKIADFGLAKLLDPQAADFTLTGTRQVLGTRNYMAPEQIEKPETVDHRADIYSLGVVFYELLTGELPLGRFSLPSEKAAVNGQLDDVVLRTLEKEPARRYQQASQIKTAVESVVRPPAGASPHQAASNIPPVQEADPSPNRAAGQPPRKRIDVPFKIEEVHGGFSEAHGIAHFDGSYLELEFRTHTMGIAKSGKQVVNIPVDEIVRVTVRKGIFSDNVEFQSDKLETFDEVPTSLQGRIRLIIEKKNTPFAEQMADEINRLASSTNRLRARRAAPPTSKQPLDSSQLHVLAHVPFKTDAHGGFAEAIGIAKVTYEHVIVEYEIHDGFGVTKSACKQAIIPASEIIAVSHRPGIFSDKIKIQSSSLEPVSEIPNSAQGKFTIATRKKDRAMAMDFVRHTANQAGLPYPVSAATEKPASLENQRSRTVQRRLRWPAGGLVLIAIFNLMIVSVAFSLMALSALPWFHEDVGRTIGQWVNESIGNSVSKTFGLTTRVVASDAGPVTWLILYASAAMAVFLMLAYTRIRSLRSYHFVVAIAILVALPIHAGFLLGLPLGVWTLIVLLDPNTKSQFEQGPYSAHVTRTLPANGTTQLARAAMVFGFLFFSVLIAMAIIAWALFTPVPEPPTSIDPPPPAIQQSPPAPSEPDIF